MIQEAKNKVLDLQKKLRILKEQEKELQKETIKEKLRGLEKFDLEELYLTEEENEILDEYLSDYGQENSFIKVKIEWGYEDGWAELWERREGTQKILILKLGDRYAISEVYDDLHEGAYQYAENHDFDFQIQKQSELRYLNANASIYDLKTNEWINVKGLLPHLPTEPIDIDSLFTQTKTKEQIRTENVVSKIKEMISKEDFVDFYLSKEGQEQVSPILNNRDMIVRIKNEYGSDYLEKILKKIDKIKINDMTKEQNEKNRLVGIFGEMWLFDFDNEIIQNKNEIIQNKLETLGYDANEIKQMMFFIKNYQEFTELADSEYMKEFDNNKMLETMIKNKYDFKSMGYSPAEVDYISYVIAHNGNKPTLEETGETITFDIDMDEVKEEISSGQYNKSYNPTLEDYKILMKLCKAKIEAKEEIGIGVSEDLPNKNEIEKMEEGLEQTYKALEELDKTNENEYANSIMQYANQKQHLTEQTQKAQQLYQEYEKQVTKGQVQE